MKSQLHKVAALVAVAQIVGCTDEGVDLPTEITTVRMAVVESGHPGGRPFATPMTTETTETPPYVGDPDGRGQALITINLGRGVVCWKLSVENILLPGTAAHIHKAPAGVRGGIAVGLTPPNASGRITGCKEDQNREVLQEILVNPSAFYVNVHTTDYPAGAVRGQLGR